MLDHFLVYCVDKTHILVVIVIDFVVVFEYTFFQLCSNTEKSFTAFLLNVRCSK